MKKPLLILTSLFLICIMLLGCTENNLAINTSKELNKNLSLLSNTVKRLDTVDNSYLMNEDLYALDETYSADTVSFENQRFSGITKLASNSTVIIEDNDTLETVDAISLKDDLKNNLQKEIINRLYCDKNGNCRICKNQFTCDDDGVCNSCNKTIICDNNGNCTYCNTPLNLDENNSRSSCQNSCVSNNKNLVSNSIKNSLIKISNDNKELIADRISNNQIVKNEDNTNGDVYAQDIVNISEYNDNNSILENNISTFNDTKSTLNTQNTDCENCTIFEENNVITETNNSDISNENLSTDSNNDMDKIEENTTDNTDTNYNNKVVKIIYYDYGIFEPEKINYNPRFVSDINYREASPRLERYINKIQKLYTMTADVIEANNSLNDKKLEIISRVKEAKDLNENIANGSFVPSDNQVDALKVYIAEIKNTVNNIRNCNGLLSNEINKISDANTGLSQSIDVISGNYLKILNQLDARISYHENAIATLEQVKAILEESINKDTITPETPSDTIIDTDNKNDTIVDNDNKVDDAIIDDTPSEITPTPEDEIVDNNESITDGNVDPDEDNAIVEDIDNANTENVGGNEHNDILYENENTEDTLTNENDSNERDDNYNTNQDLDDNFTNTEDKNIVDDENNHQVNNDNISNDDFSNDNSENEIENNDTILNDKTNANQNSDIEEVIGYTDEPIDNVNVTNDNNVIFKKNIDSYKENTLPNINIDTLNNPFAKNKNENINNVQSQDQIENNGTTDNVILNENEIDNTNNGVTNNTQNNMGNNLMDNGNGYYRNNFNGGYANSIINDNNIDNNDIGNSSYRYDSTGHLYNNTNGFDSYAEYNQNLNGNNINTYKYNTMVDTINRGTVNNGINTL